MLSSCKSYYWRIGLLGLPAYLIILFMLIGNSLVVLSVLLFKSLRTLRNGIIASLAIADLLVASTVLPFAVIDLTCRRWIFPQSFCAFYIMLDFISCQSSIFHICLIAVEQYIIISSPLRYEQIRKKLKVIVSLAILVIWTLSIVIAYYFTHNVAKIDTTPHQLTTLNANFTTIPKSKFKLTDYLGKDVASGASGASVFVFAGDNEGSSSPQQTILHLGQVKASFKDFPSILVKTKFSVTPGLKRLKYKSHSETEQRQHDEGEEDSCLYLSKLSTRFALIVFLGGFLVPIVITVFVYSKIYVIVTYHVSSMLAQYECTLSQHDLMVNKTADTAAVVCKSTKEQLSSYVDTTPSSGSKQTTPALVVQRRGRTNIFTNRKICHKMQSGNKHLQKDKSLSSSSNKILLPRKSYQLGSTPTPTPDTDLIVLPNVVNSSDLVFEIPEIAGVEVGERSHVEKSFGANGNEFPYDYHQYHHFLPDRYFEKRRSVNHEIVTPDMFDSSVTLCRDSNFVVSATIHTSQLFGQLVKEEGEEAEPLVHIDSATDNHPIRAVDKKLNFTTGETQILRTPHIETSNSRLSSFTRSSCNFLRLSSLHHHHRAPRKSVSQQQRAKRDSTMYANIRSNRDLLKEKKAIKTLGMVLGAFLVCWTPYFVVFLIHPYCNYCIPVQLFLAVTWLGYLNSALNPIIYAIFNPRFRRAFKALASCSMYNIKRFDYVD